MPHLPPMTTSHGGLRLRSGSILALLLVLLAAAAIFSHRANIQRLLHGKENRIDFRKIKVKPDDNDKTKG